MAQVAKVLAQEEGLVLKGGVGEGLGGREGRGGRAAAASSRLYVRQMRPVQSPHALLWC